MFLNFFLILLFNFRKVSPLCKESENYCKKCNPLTGLCISCINEEIFVTDTKGGCIGSQKCIPGKFYCLECEDEGKFCKSCDKGYYPDENGFCSYYQDCKISYKGECIECKDDFILIEKYKICKSVLNDDFKNCKEIDKDLGLCKICEDEFYLNEGDKRCTKTENCYESIFGNCILCNKNFYLDKKENKCKEKNGIFKFCKQTIDGKNCDICDSGNYFDKEGICVENNFCSKSLEGICTECISGYYFSYNNKFCTNSKYCFNADKDTGLCLECNKNYYLDSTNYECKSNIEENEFKFCMEIIDNICVKCEKGYYLGKDFKCTNTPNCDESDNGKCILCSENFYLGKDNFCSDVKYCIYTRYNYCIECEDGYYYSPIDKKCFKSTGIKGLENCKYTCIYPNGIRCCECKNEYYLNSNQSLCLDNNEIGPFYKCALVDNNENCYKCINGYYLGSNDRKCTLIKNCKISENENKCILCDEYFCLDAKKGNCISNEFLEDVNVKIYFACNRTNDQGTKCEKCIEGYEANEEGYCIDVKNCIEKKEGKCLSCNKEKNENGFYYCANDVFGCVEGNFENCLRCDDLNDLYSCTECKEGYMKDSFGNCVKI